jgi:hypothetical protein
LLPNPRIPRLQLPILAAAAGAAVFGALTLYRRLRPKTAEAVVHGRRAGQAPRATVVVVESDGPVREPARCEVPW